MHVASNVGICQENKRPCTQLHLMCTPPQDYLEAKRLAFPRLYFISNNELLDMLAHIRNPFAVQVSPQLTELLYYL